MKKHFISIIALLCFLQQAHAQFYNDGQIRLRIWVHKVWSNVDDALCTSGPDYVFRDIQVRVPNPTGGVDISPLGLHMRTNDCNQSE